MAHRRDPAEPNDDDDEPEVVIDSHTRTGCKAPAPAYIHPAIPAAVARVIVVTPRALSQLQTSPSPSNDSTPQKNATAIHPAVFFAERGPQPVRTVSSQKNSCSCGTYYPFADCDPCATTSDPGPSLQHSDLDLDLDVHGPHGLGCGCGRVIDDEADPHAHVSTTVPVHLDACPKRRRRIMSLSSIPTFCHQCRTKTRWPKMRCMLMNASAGEWCGHKL